MKKRPPKTLLEQVYVLTGRSMRDTGKVWQLVLAWSMCMQDRNTEELGIYEFVYWAEDGVFSVATSERYLALFRKAFPNDRDPNRVCIESGLFEKVGPAITAAHQMKDSRRKSSATVGGTVTV